MEYYEVAPTKIVRLDIDVLTYSSDAPLNIGQVVSIPVGKKETIGLIMKKVSKPSFETKPISRIVTSQSVPSQLIETANWLSKYYQTHLSSVIQMLLPPKVETKRRSRATKKHVQIRKRTNILFNDEQSSAIQTVLESDPGTFLIQGVTGSGKTEVYIELTKQTLSSGKSVIVLVPEISLTSQIVDNFHQHFDDIKLIHSSIGESERHLIWDQVINSEKPLVLMGTRSALFYPLNNVGLIVLDESHEPSYKQDQSPKYSSLRAATILGRAHKAKVIFGSATPNVVDRYLAEQQNRPIIRLTKKARKNTKTPNIEVIDMTKRTNFTKHRFISDSLIKTIELGLAKKEQSLIFHNRRGSASLTLCENCGYSVNCPNCFLPLTLHADKHILMCHICSHKETVPSSCPSCHHADIIFKGFGTKLIESELRKLFPKANIKRFDADNLSNETLEANYGDLYSGEIDIAIGTQVVAKGLDLPHLRTVGIIQADSGLNLPDYVSHERTFQLITQVAGRVGRSNHKTDIIVQSYQPTHPVIKFGLSEDYDSFYQEVLVERQKSHFPPYCYIMKLTCSYKNESSTIKAAKQMSGVILDNLGSKVRILGPTPAFYERRGEFYRWQLVIKSSRREHLLKIAELVPKTYWQYDIDPSSLI